MNRYVVIALILLCGIFFFPVPVVRNVENSSINIVQYNANFGRDVHARMMELSAYDEARILECLHQYSEYRTLLWTRSANLSELEFYIWIEDGTRSKFIGLGDVNYTDEFGGNLNLGHAIYRHGIYHADALREELRSILDVSESNQIDPLAS